MTILLIGITILLHTINCKEVDSWLLEGNFEVLGGDGGPQFQRLVDGEDADEGKHPWHVGLVREESKTGVLGWIRHLGGLLRTTTYCGATLVSDRWLLTAAHCIREGDRPVDLRVNLPFIIFYFFFIFSLLLFFCQCLIRNLLFYMMKSYLRVNLIFYLMENYLRVNLIFLFDGKLYHG